MKAPLPVLRAAAWLSVIAIAYLSLAPHSMEVRTALPPGVEHLIAYAGAAGLMALAYPQRPGWVIAVLLFGFSGLMELLQNFSPGRHPGVAGALWSGTGAAIGASMVRVRRGTPPA